MVTLQGSRNFYGILYVYYPITCPHAVILNLCHSFKFRSMLYVQFEHPNIGRAEDLYSFVSRCIWTETSFVSGTICGPLNSHPFFTSVQKRSAFHGGTNPLLFLNFVSNDRVMHVTFFYFSFFYLHSEHTNDSVGFDFCSVRWLLLCNTQKLMKSNVSSKRDRLKC